MVLDYKIVCLLRRNGMNLKRCHVSILTPSIVMCQDRHMRNNTTPTHPRGYKDAPSARTAEPSLISTVQRSYRAHRWPKSWHTTPLPNASQSLSPPESTARDDPPPQPSQPAEPVARRRDMIVIRPWPNGPAECGAVVAAGPHGVLLAGRQTSRLWTSIYVFDEYDTGDEYRHGEPEWTPSLFVDCETVR